MSAKTERYRAELASLPATELTDYLSANSNLPGPRGNLELLAAFAQVAPEEWIAQLITADDEFVRACAVAAIGVRAGAKAPAHESGPAPSTGPHPAQPRIDQLRRHATDPSWRVREAVAMALQYLGDADRPALRAVALDWAADDDPLVQRAAIAGICEPRLLDAPTAQAALATCRLATETFIARDPQLRRSADQRVLRKALGYCWSVAIAADPPAGLVAFDQLRAKAADDVDLAWIVRENSRKSRLARLLEPPSSR